MRKYRRHLVIGAFLALVAVPGLALAGLGLGLGMDEARSPHRASGGGPPPGCAANLVFDQSVACHAVSWTLMGK